MCTVQWILYNRLYLAQRCQRLKAGTNKKTFLGENKYYGLIILFTCDYRAKYNFSGQTLHQVARCYYYNYMYIFQKL